MSKALPKVRDYELMLMIKPLLPDDVRKSVHKDILNLVKDADGSVEDVDVWGKRYLAYEIKGHSEGYYILYHLRLPSDAYNEIRRQLSLKQEVLRFLFTIIEDPSKMKKKIKKKQIDFEV